MNSSYLNSVRNIVLLSKPSKTIGLLLMVLFVFIMPQFSFGQKTWDGGGDGINWSSANNWNPNGVPTAGQTVVIANDINITIDALAVCSTFTISGGNRANTVTISGSNSLTVSGAITIGAGTGSGDNKIINVGTGSLSAASISMAATGNDNRYVRVSLSTGTVSVSGNITMNDIDVDRNQVTFSGSGTLNVGGTITGGALTPSTGTVNYNNSGNQNIGNYTYNNLTLSGSGTKTFGASTTINNNFSIASGAIANLGTGLTHSAGILTLGGEGTVPGSWGSTSSSATNQNNTYFAATTGRVNNSCTAPTITEQPTTLTICENSGGSFSVSAIGGSTYQWQYSGDNINWVNIDSALAPYVSGYTTANFTLTNTPAAWTNNYVRCIVWSSTGCRTNSNSVLLTVSSALSAPTVGTITQPTCSTATGSVVLTGLPTGSWSLTRTPGSVTTTGTGTSITISGLAAGITYTYTVNGLTNGLKGEYYNNMTLSGSPTLTRTDATVNFDWSTGSPDASINTDGFSVRWSGLVQPQYSETYTFSTVSDDGIRLWVNGVQIINNWTDHAPTTNTGTIALTAGVKYNIVLEYYENAGGAVSQLSWSSANQISQIIPTTRLFPVGSCPSPASANIVINAQPATPSVPTGTSTQSFCSSSNPTVASLTATGTAIQWYAAASGGSALATTTALVNGAHYYATQTTSGCESTTRFDVTVTVNPAPLAPGTSTPNSPSCSGFTAQWAWTANTTAYYLDVATDSGFTSIVSAYNNLNVGNVLSYALTGLNPATTYYYRVRASGCSTSVSSATMSLATSSVAIPGTASPHSPSCNGFTAQWAWTANATTYYLDVATDNGFTSIVPAYNNLNVGNVLNYVLTGLNPGTTYYYRVRASGCGTSTSSATMTYATTASPTTAPTASAATSSNCNDATLNWNSIANATAYYLDIATDSGFTTFVSGYNNLYIGYYPSSGYYAGSLPSGVVLFYRVRATNGCNVTTTSSNTVTFQTAAPLGGSVSSAQSIYSGTSPADLTLTGYSATNIIYWQKSTDAAFTSPTNITETTATLSGATIGNLFTDTYFRAVVQNQFGSWCISNSNPVLITVVVVAAPLPPTTTVVHPSCAVSTGSITVTSPVPAADISYTVVGTNPVVAGVTNTTGVFSGLVAGDYNVIVNNTVTGLSTGKSETINAIVTNTWNGTVWSDGTPNSNQKIVFAANYSSTGNISACSCMVTSGAVTFNANDTLTLTNELKITAGSLTFENSASLVQINDAAINSGNIIYKRNTSSVRISDYTYWSSPVANQNLAISPAYTSGMFYSFNDFATPETWKSESASTIMTVGKGYIIRGQQIGSPTPPPPPSFYQATFTGTPHNGNKSIAIGPIGNSNLLGNPYPSAIDADKFLSANSTVIEGTIYFWTHNTAIQLASNITNGTAGSGAFAYTSDDYASYNGTGGVAVSGGIIPTGEIAAGQAFFTTSKATGGSVAFNNAMRLSSGGAILDNSQFFKIKNTKGKTAQIEKNRIWLNLTNAKGAFKQTLVGYIAGATNDIDNAFDGESFDGQEFIDFYSVNQGKNLTIQGRALPFSENDEVPLGFRSTIEGPFTISIDQVDGSMTNQKIFIEDKLTNTITDLSADNYTFSTVAGTFNDRFVLRYTNGKTLGTDTVTTQENKVVVSIQNKQIKINSLSETINKVAIFDLLGRQIYQNNKVDSNEFLTTDFSSSHQALIVKTTLQNGELVTNKIIF